MDTCIYIQSISGEGVDEVSAVGNTGVDCHVTPTGTADHQILFAACNLFSSIAPQNPCMKSIP